MDAVEIRKALDGGYWITARSDTLAEAMWGVDALLAKSSEAFDAIRAAVLGPPDFPPRSYGDECTEAYAPPDETALPPHALADADDNVGDLKAGEVFREHGA